MIPFPLSNLFNSNKLQTNKETSSSPNSTIKLKGDNNNVSQTINIVNESTPSKMPEEQRIIQLISQLRNQWLLENDGVTSARIAGIGWGNGEQNWINDQLSKSGELYQINDENLIQPTTDI